MPCHCEHSDHGCGTGRDRALASRIGSLFSVTLDTGDADEFTFSKAGAFACFGGLCPHGQGKVAIAS
ncbi:hypothetical protein [Mesorhizobium sp. BH1-1-4]|uniref:hypothetical protein n=1 Tax=Mesorhizobium sp. BH1-1-4 TaxID=2876662 RepID=UPI001CD08443|nr:hypothetical protein [Mesorhizobium sp. BH1-1-4]MBZ9997718.1 hypothetical protein [Mesorhizobium sp. BH1-1-4]